MQSLGREEELSDEMYLSFLRDQIIQELLAGGRLADLRESGFTPELLASLRGSPPRVTPAP